MAHVLVVDDEKDMRNLLRIYLTKEGFTITEAQDGNEALTLLEHQMFDIIVLDIMMPGLNGLQVCEHIRKRNETPILMLTARSETKDKVQGLKLGADDYLAKPFDPEELLARIIALLRRVNRSLPSTDAFNRIRYGELEIEVESRQVTVHQLALDMTPKEFDLLYYLASRPRKAVTREELLDQIWGHLYEGDIRTVDTHVKTIRDKLRKAGLSQLPIQTVWGFGYKFQSIDEQS